MYLKSDVDKLDVDKLKNVPVNSNNFTSKVDKLIMINVLLLQNLIS